MNIDLGGMTAFVTGGSKGIGKGIAEALVKCGANVGLTARGQDDLDAAVAELNEIRDGASFGVVGDVSDFGSITAAVAAVVDRFGGLDFAVNNAGIDGDGGLLHETGPENWRRVIGINLDGVAYSMMAEFAEMTKRSGGAIVNVASVEGHGILPNNAAYTTTKHTLMGLTKATAADYAPHGIRINSVSPGVVATPLTMAAPLKDSTERMADRIPMGRIGQPEDIGPTVAFLLSGLSGYTTGADLVVDGAFLLRE